SRANRGRGLPARGHSTRVRLRGAAPPVLDGPSSRCVPSGGGCVTRFASCEQDFVAVVVGAGGVMNFCGWRASAVDAELAGVIVAFEYAGPYTVPVWREGGASSACAAHSWRRVGDWEGL